MILFSFIIPHKNLPSIYLRRCLDSIPHREDVQIIVVDDNSDPTMVSFDNFPGMGEPCTEVFFTKEDRGAGYARNIGLKYALGKWIFFADSDDYYLDSINDLLIFLMNKDADIVYFNFVKDADNFINERHKVYENQFFDLKGTVLKSETPWRKVVNRQLIYDHNIYFEEVKYGNDAMFALKTDYYAKKVDIFNSPIYCWVQRKNSLCRQDKTSEWYICRIKGRFRLYKFASSHRIIHLCKPYNVDVEWLLKGLKDVSSFAYVRESLSYTFTFHSINGIKNMIESYVADFRVSLGKLKFWNLYK